MLTYYQREKLECGVDEAGRGCLAGPVVAAAVILPLDFYHPEIQDSKKLSQKKRYRLKEIIIQEAIAWNVGIISVQTIDLMNILNASFLAMNEAIEGLSRVPELLIIDGNRFKNYTEIPHICLIKGDSKNINVAAASILAKTIRDDIMDQLHEEFPAYDWKGNKGYPTENHRKAIEKLGLTKYHRKSFQCLKPRNLFSDEYHSF